MVISPDGPGQTPQPRRGGGIIALAVLSGVWPDNHTSQILLTAWVLAQR
ncbi:hypothetical protein [Streptacidiphilus sp. MAP5-3]